MERGVERKSGMNAEGVCTAEKHGVGEGMMPRKN